jgi:hypothetical protein
MSDSPQQRLLEALLDSWDRNNTILLNLLRALPSGGLDVRAMDGGPSIGELFTHINYVRLVFVLEDAPEFATEVPENEWVVERDPVCIARMLSDSARAVRDAVHYANVVAVLRPRFCWYPARTVPQTHAAVVFRGQ